MSIRAMIAYWDQLESRLKTQLGDLNFLSPPQLQPPSTATCLHLFIFDVSLSSHQETNTNVISTQTLRNDNIIH